MNLILNTLAWIFASTPAFLTYFIIFKIFFPNKISKKTFLVVSIILLIISSLFIWAFIATIPDNNLITIPLTFSQIINHIIGKTLYLYSFYFNIITVLLLPVILIAGLIYSIKSKNKIFAVKTIAISLILSFILCLTSPAFYDIYIYFNRNKISKEKELELYEIAADKSILIPMKSMYIQLAELYLYFNIISSDNNSKNIEKWIKYKEQEAELLNYNEYYILVVKCTEYKKFEESHHYIKRLEELGFDKKRIEKLYKYVSEQEMH